MLPFSASYPDIRIKFIDISGIKTLDPMAFLLLEGMYIPMAYQGRARQIRFTT
jgi:hypothetical protein